MENILKVAELSEIWVANKVTYFLKEKNGSKKVNYSLVSAVGHKDVVPESLILSKSDTFLNIRLEVLVDCSDVVGSENEVSALEGC